VGNLATPGSKTPEGITTKLGVSNVKCQTGATTSADTCWSFQCFELSDRFQPLQICIFSALSWFVY